MRSLALAILAVASSCDRSSGGREADERDRPTPPSPRPPIPPPPPGPPPAAIPPKPPIPAERLTAAREAARGDVAFASWLLADLGRTPGNLCVSPLSLRAAGALPAIGARGTTADELRRGFALTGDRQRSPASGR